MSVRSVRDGARAAPPRRLAATSRGRQIPTLVLLGLFSVACGREEKIWSVPAADPATRRTTRLGDVVGGEGRYESYAWLGIPFAAPPVGDLRWRAPHPPAPWSNAREALHFAPACSQFASPIGGDAKAPPGTPTGSEDCLYLNVWTPKLPPDQIPVDQKRLPVMFWIHGGGNSIGTASFYEGGHIAASQNVVVVSTQYRLGPFGWFRNAALRGDEADPAAQSGNFGTLDLIESLKWVRDNISAFGGDPGNITIFGESAGGLNVYSLLVAPGARGLFSHAIIESGGLSQVTPDDAEHFVDDAVAGEKNSSNELLVRLLIDDHQAADRAAAKTRLAAMAPAEIATYLRSKSAAQILTPYRSGTANGMIGMPLVFRDGTVLPADDWALRFADPKLWNQVAVMVGTNRDEDKLFLFLDPHRVWKMLGVLPQFVDETN